MSACRTTRHTDGRGKMGILHISVPAPAETGRGLGRNGVGMAERTAHHTTGDKQARRG